MERLTERERNVDGTGVAKEEITDGLLKPFADKILTKLAVYEDLEEQGLLVRLPCKVGDTTFRINKGAKNPIIELTVAQINIIRKSYNLEVVDKDGGELMYFKSEIGNSIFLTREEAEKKLEEMKK